MNTEMNFKGYMHKRLPHPLSKTENFSRRILPHAELRVRVAGHYKPYSRPVVF
jgi:hypothetical protein